LSPSSHGIRPRSLGAGEPLARLDEREPSACLTFSKTSISSS